MMREQIAYAREHFADGHKWTDSIAEQTVRYALWRHARNLAEYRWVMGGFR